jgi:hypothetical protein
MATGVTRESTKGKLGFAPLRNSVSEVKLRTDDWVEGKCRK